MHVSLEFWLVVFTAALVIVGILQYRVFRAQEKRMEETVDLAQKSADAAKDSAKAAAETVELMRATSEKELRARVFIESAKRAGTGPVSFSAEITIKNFGKIPASECTYFFAMQCLPISESPPILHPSGQEPRMVLPPGAEVRDFKTLPTGTFQITQENLVRAGANAVCVYGRIEYGDGFGNRRHSAFFMKCCGSDYDLGRFSFCQTGNEAD
jgi:hypothetical protein